MGRFVNEFRCWNYEQQKDGGEVNGETIVCDKPRTAAQLFADRSYYKNEFDEIQVAVIDGDGKIVVFRVVVMKSVTFHAVEEIVSTQQFYAVGEIADVTDQGEI